MFLTLFLLTILSLPLNGQLDKNGLPNLLTECYLQRNTNTGQVVNCLERYLESLHDGAWRVLDREAIDWINSLGRQALDRMPVLYGKCKKIDLYRGKFSNKKQSTLEKRGKNRRGRGNRKSVYNPRRRVRREIRTLSDTERKEYFDAVNALKYDTSIRPNKYDALALLHQNDAIPSAHDGPNILGWHRYYLVLFEEALRTKNPNMAIPYWDSTLDFRMKDPSQSIYWTEIFVGNPTGVVFTGPYANWITPRNNSLLRRGIPGPGSSLIDSNLLREVFKQKYHYQILFPTNVSLLSNFESHHDGVHRWIGGSDGHMGGLSTSSQEPAFWNFHCHIDYLWEFFRERQRKRGIDSSRDYPVVNIPEHQPYRRMDNLWPPLLNIHGYSNEFTQYIYRYKDAPSCRNKCGGARKEFLYCNKRINQCVSRSRSGFIKMNGFRRVRSSYISSRRGRTPSFQPARNSFLSDIAEKPYIPRKFRSGIVDPRTM